MFESTRANHYRRRLMMLGGAYVMLIGLLAGATPQAHAAALESFDSYTAGSLLGGLDGGGGWSSAWTANYSPTYTEWRVVSGGLDGSANSLQFTRDVGSRLPSVNEDERSAKRSISSSPNTGSGPVYFGFYFQHDAAFGAGGATDPNRFLLEWRTNTTRYLTFGIEGDEVFVKTTADALSDKQLSNSDLIADNTTYHIVVKLEQDAGGPATVGGGTGERVSFFINPTSDIEPAVADFVYTGGASMVYPPGQTFNRVRLYGDYYNGQSATIDRLILADNFASALAPEPTTALLLSLAAPMMLRRRTRA